MDLTESLLRLVRTGDDHTARQMLVLLLLRRSQTTVRALADEMNVGKPAVTRATDRLVGEDYVRRSEEPGDRRGVVLSLTRKGRDFAASMVER